MRAIEIFEQTGPAQKAETLKNPKLLFTNSEDSYYELDDADWQRLKKYIARNRSGNNDRLQQVPSTGARYFILVPSQKYDYKTNSYSPVEATSWANLPYYDVRIYALVNDELQEVTEGGHSTKSLGDFKKFIKFTGAQRSVWKPLSNKKIVVRNGKIMTIKDALETLRIDTLDGMPVYKGTPQDVDILYDQNPMDIQRKWDTLYLIHSPVLGAVFINIKAGEIINRPWDPNKWATSLKLLRDFCSKYKIPLPKDLPVVSKSGKPRWVKPGSNFHKMLKYVSTHPGATRSDWYVKHLGNDPQGMQGWTSPTSPDGVAANAGLIQNNSTTPSKYSLEITTPGQMVLSVLDAGQKIDLNELDDDQ